LFDRPPLEEGSILLATACVWRVAAPNMAALVAREAESGSQESGQYAIVLDEMPAVEVFGVVCALGQWGADYPFTSSLYESTAYAHFRKQHFVDLLLPSTMAEAHAANSVALAERSLVLWNALYIEG